MFVTVTSVAAMLVMASVPADNMDMARTVYSNCVIDNVVAHLENKMDADTSKSQLAGVCQDEQKAFVAAVVKYERSEGASATEAKEYAEEEVLAILDEASQSYAQHLEEGTRPEKDA